jgi:hypothetical protein
MNMAALQTEIFDSAVVSVDLGLMHNLTHWAIKTTPSNRLQVRTYVSLFAASIQKNFLEFLILCVLFCVCAASDTCVGSPLSLLSKRSTNKQESVPSL